MLGKVLHSNDLIYQLLSVRPQLQYYIQFWGPYFQDDTERNGPEL